MAKFFQLHSKRAAALYRYRHMQFSADIHEGGFEDSIPLDYRILPGRRRAVEVAIFEKQQSFDDQWRNGIDFIEQKFRLAITKQRRAVATADFQAIVGALGVRGRNATLQKCQRGFRLARLFGDLISLSRQPCLKNRQFGITLPLIERAGTRKGDFPTWSLRQVIKYAAVGAGEKPRLNGGCLELDKNADKEQQQESKREKADLQAAFYH